MRWQTRLTAALFAVLFFGTLLARLYLLQIRDHDFYSRKAAGQQLRDTVVPAPRGEILSADGKVLAASADCWTVRASPRELQDAQVQPAAAALAQLLELEEADVLEKLSDRTSNDKLLRRRVDRAAADAVRSWCREQGVAGISVLQDTRRWYPEGAFCGSVLGFTNVDNAGVAGLELRYDRLLTGRSGAVLTAKNAWGYEMPTHYAAQIPPVPGGSLTLTIDSVLQHSLEKYLSFAVQEHHVSARGVGIVMDVNTGAILALSTKPDYDPNQPRRIADDAQREQVDARSGEEHRRALGLAQQRQWRNKAVSDLYEPGSVFKLFTCAAALDAGAVVQSDHFYCGSSINVAGTRFHCANHRRHGSQDVALALRNSCNQSFIQIGQKLGKERFFEYFRAFGLCGATGIDLPGEAKKSEYYTPDRMGPVELASCSFGQSSKITPIQVITAVSAVVNGGKLMEPYVAASARDAAGRELWRREPVLRRQVLSPEVSARMREMMEGVVQSGGGHNAYVAGYRVGGKTGTSQKLDSPDDRARIASFVGVAPIEDPRIAVLIALDEPHSFSTGGGALAAPVAGRIIEDAMEHYQIPARYTPEEQQRMEVTVPRLAGLSPEQAQKRLAQAGLACKVLGGGPEVLGQNTSPGEKLPRGSTLLLFTEPSMSVRPVTVPALVGQEVRQVRAALTAQGLNLRARGPADAPGAVAVAQLLPPGQTAAMSSVVEVWFCDPSAAAEEG